MNKNGGFMGGEIIFLLAAMGVAVFGVYKYISSETNDYNTLVDQMKIMDGVIQTQGKELQAQGKALEKLRQEVLVIGGKFESVEKDMDSAQEHMAKLRSSQVDLRDRSYPRTLEVKVQAPTGAIPIEIYTPTKKKVAKKAVTKKKRVRTNAPKKKIRVRKKSKRKAAKKKTSRIKLPGTSRSKKALAEARL